MVAHAVLGRAHLHDDVATALDVVRGESAFPRIHVTARFLRPARERAHRRRRDRTEAHAADVDDGAGLERVLAIALADDDRRRRHAILLQHRERVIDEDDRARLAKIVGRAEADDAAFALRQPVDEAARCAVERHLGTVARKEILAEIFAEILEEKAQMPDDRIVAQHRVLFLRDVVQDQHDQPADQHEADDRADAVREYAQDAFHPAP